MLPRNPPPENFGQLLDVFRMSRRVHRLIEPNLVAGANFAHGWIQKWHPRLNYSSMSLSLPPGRATLQVHMDAILQPARRIIGRLLDTSPAYLQFFMLHAYFYTICLLFRYTSWHFYAFSGTNLLTSCHSASFLFSAIFVFQK
jgi:hypothetical protein